jgi:hypothetical protein
MVRVCPPNSTVFILGAGFSRCAGIPIQAEFASLLLSDEFSSELDKAITRTLRGLLNDVFGWRDGSAFPALEDIFTCIDLSAATGHHLGIKYTPKLLRAIRRMAIYRIFSVLDRRFLYSRDIDTLLRTRTSAALDLTGFLVLNWDIVLEKHLAQIDPPIAPDYACEAVDWDRPSCALTNDRRITVCKMHGSSNWVYCENCKSLFYDLDEKLSLRTKVGLIKADFRLFDEKFSGSLFDSSLGIDPRARQCPLCNNMVSSHIATFSYRKSFRTHAYTSIWYRAEKILSNADHWVFIGYSLPKADYELKHLLKVAQLRIAHKRQNRKLTIDIVVSGESALGDYEAFFGKDAFTFYSGGLEGYVRSVAAATDTAITARE